MDSIVFFQKNIIFRQKTVMIPHKTYIPIVHKLELAIKRDFSCFVMKGTL